MSSRPPVLRSLDSQVQTPKEHKSVLVFFESRSGCRLEAAGPQLPVEEELETGSEREEGPRHEDEDNKDVHKFNNKNTSEMY
ncbi:hypothetical protein EYF80_055122 [Liparis tanakae]|uniref:Uncharacterized protein n=1 Tax=Liparis tanakae TaxID=230148 RepID=A0A4Z2F1G1_9TELE|nr:hypothetical protein EYF80_055122 [Liparis tanakae]